MRQRTFKATAGQSFDELLLTVASSAEYLGSRTRLLIALEPTCDQETVSARITRANELLPGATIVGMSVLGISLHEDDRDLPVLSLVTFESAKIEVNAYDCTSLTCEDAGRQLARTLAGRRDLRGIFCLTSYARLCPEPFFEEVRQALPGVVIFGAQAGPEDVTLDRSIVFTNAGVSDRGILTVALMGRDLHIKADYNLGWHPAGRSLQVTRSNRTAINSIDDQAPSAIYRHYLDVRLDEHHFLDNIGPFPLVYEDYDRLIARTPVGFFEDGSLQFTMQLKEGSQVQLSYANKKDLLLGSNSNAYQMSMFSPQALLLFACVVRHTFLGEDARRELGYYHAANPNYCLGYGYSEILLSGNNHEALLNNSLVAVGMREGPLPSSTPVPCIDRMLTAPQGDVVPLTDRLATFLSATTEDLRATIASLETLAGEDQLTGIFNRRSVQRALADQIARKDRTGSTAILMYDIDHFKAVNDTYGHDVGDAVLSELTACVDSIVRSNDTHGRWGGEEFLCLVPNADIRAAEQMAERILTAVQNHDFPVIRKVTISIGITTLRADDTLETLFSRVDEALYDAKNSGRNCIRVR